MLSFRGTKNQENDMKRKIRRRMHEVIFLAKSCRRNVRAIFIGRDFQARRKLARAMFVALICLALVN